MQIRPLLDIFRQHFEGTPRAFRSPGRINIIGEHTDYNEGFVLPAGIDKEIVVLIAPNSSDQINLISVDQNEQLAFSLHNYGAGRHGWPAYILGVVDRALKAGLDIQGFDCVFGGNIPIGAGLSSSAALECATLFGLNEIFGWQLGRKEIALMAQAAENRFVGVNCGIMDQFASVFALENHALKLDCRDLSYRPFEIHFGEYGLVLVDSQVKHSLASSEYNTRRLECEAAVIALRTLYPDIDAIRDAQLHQLEQVKNLLSDKEYHRAKYVIEEIERVSIACTAIEKDQLNELGRLLYASHDGLQHLYEVSCTELDFLVDFTRSKPEVLGARMMGGGFGGCTLNLIRQDQIVQFSEEISDTFEKQFGSKPGIYPVKTAQGSSEILLTL